MFSVGDVLEGLRGLLEDQIGRVWVAGEISNLRRAASGHSYFTLKDAAGQLRSVLFRGNARRIPFELEDGLEVLAEGELSIYAARGDLQLIVRQLEPRGQGALQLAIEQLRARLEQEGLFDPARKRPIPGHPRRVGVVTSPTGAAIRDVIEVSGRRAPATPLLIAATRVQGEGAEHEIAEAIARVARQPGIDVVLVVRGGGSFEDLLAFNSEVVARAIAASPVPVVAGVGHETDVSLADLAADLRAPTPSVAAERALPDREALRLAWQAAAGRLRAAILVRLDDAEADLGRHRAALRVAAPRARLEAAADRLAALGRALGRAAVGVARTAGARLGVAAGRLDSLSPLAVLGRGYAIVFAERDGSIVRRAAALAPGDPIRVRLAEGELRAEVRRTAASGGHQGN